MWDGDLSVDNFKLAMRFGKSYGNELFFGNALDGC
jgi:hypothetical protein